MWEQAGSGYTITYILYAAPDMSSHLWSDGGSMWKKNETTGLSYYTYKRKCIDETGTITEFITCPNGNCTFLGWSTIAGGSVEYKYGDKIYLTGNITLYSVY
mgnify:CR=1 FL=1